MRTNAPAADGGGFTGFIRDVNRFFFQPTDTATLGLIRICAGLLILWVHLVYSYQLYDLFGRDAWISYDLATEIRKEYPIQRAWLDWQMDHPDRPTPTAEEAARLNAYRNKWLKADQGIDPRDLWTQGNDVWSVWFHVTDPTWMVVIHVGILVCMLAFALGLWTPVTGIVTWLGMLSYVNRAATTFFGMDTIMNVLVLYLTLAHLFARPGTAALSLDRLLWRWRKARQAGVSLSAVGGDTTAASANFAIRLMQIHFCVIYLASGLSKLMGSAWWNGTAIWGTVANPEFAALHLRYYHDTISWLARHRVLWELSMTGGAMFTLVLEIGFPFLVWNRRLRWLMVIGAVLLHTGIALFMGLVGFSLMMLALLVSFIPPSTVRQLLGLADRVPSLVPSSTPLASAAPVGAGRA
jgi:hypothetical protein